MDRVLGTIDCTELVFIRDPAQTDFSGKTGLAHTALTVGYARVETDNDTPPVDVTSSLNPLGDTDALHNDWGWVELNSTYLPGWYRLDIADAVFAAGATKAVVNVMITASAAVPCILEYNLVSGDLNSISSRLPEALSGDNLMQVNVQKILNADPETAADVKNEVFDGAIEVGFPLINIMKALSSLVGGKTSGVGTGHIVFRSINDSRNCVEIDISGGNRVVINFNFVDP